jgi:hypothetical protein
MRGILYLVAAFAIGLGSGCTNARYVHKAGDQGIVAVMDRSDSWPSYNITNAKKLIEAHVGPEYDILEEKEVVTGNQTTNQQNIQRDTAVNPFVPFLQNEQQTTQTTTTTTPVKEWQIHYRRRMGTQVGNAIGGPGPIGGLGVQQAGAQMPIQQQMPVVGQRPGVSQPLEIPSVMPGGGTTNSYPANPVSPASFNGGAAPGGYPPKPTITVTGN